MVAGVGGSGFVCGGECFRVGAAGDSHARSNVQGVCQAEKRCGQTVHEHGLQGYLAHKKTPTP